MGSPGRAPARSPVTGKGAVMEFAPQAGVVAYTTPTSYPLGQAPRYDRGASAPPRGGEIVFRFCPKRNQISLLKMGLSTIYGVTHRILWVCSHGIQYKGG